MEYYKLGEDEEEIKTIEHILPTIEFDGVGFVFLNGLKPQFTQHFLMGQQKVIFPWTPLILSRNWVLGPGHILRSR